MDCLTNLSDLQRTISASWEQLPTSLPYTDLLTLAHIVSGEQASLHNVVTLRPPSPCWKSVHFETEKKHHGNHLGIMSASELRIFLSASGGGGDLELRTGELITFKVFADHPLGNV